MAVLYQDGHDLTRLVMYTAAGRLADRGFRMMRDIWRAGGDCFDTTPCCDGQSVRQTDRQGDGKFGLRTCEKNCLVS